MTESIYILKLYMPGTKISRIFEVPGSSTLEQLQKAIHESFAFDSFEMYAFFPDNKLLSSAGYYAPQMRKPHTTQVTLRSLGLPEGQRFLYVYDLQKMYQFYIHIERIVTGEPEGIVLIRKNGELQKEPQVKEVEEVLGEDEWFVERAEVDMEVLSSENPRENLLATAYSMNLEVDRHADEKTIADAIIGQLYEDERFVFRMLSIPAIQLLNTIWHQEEGVKLEIPARFLYPMSLLGFIGIHEEEHVIEYSVFAKRWMEALLESTSNLIWVDLYRNWHQIARGLFLSYGVLQMDDFFDMMQKYSKDPLDVDEICDFVMQRMEWNDEVNAIENGKDWFWSIPDPERAARILKRREMYPATYKEHTEAEIKKMMETAGWTFPEKAQDLFACLQGLALDQNEVRRALGQIVELFSKGYEPHEIMAEALPPRSTLPKPAYQKVRKILREIKAMLPDYGLWGYTEEEFKKIDPDYRSIEGITILPGIR